MLRMTWSRPRPNSWKGFLLGLIGGAVGVMAMDAFQQQISPLFTGQDAKDNEDENGDRVDEAQPLDEIAVVGVHHEQNESSTAALGRIIYHWTTGHDPTSKESKSMMSYLVHWAYGIVQGGIYGAGSSLLNLPSLRGGLAFGGGLWLIGDEVVVPMLGLQEGPTAYPIRTHGNRLALHLVYGLVTSTTTALLRRLF